MDNSRFFRPGFSGVKLVTLRPIAGPERAAYVQWHQEPMLSPGDFQVESVEYKIDGLDADLASLVPGDRVVLGDSQYAVTTYPLSDGHGVSTIYIDASG